MARSIQLRVRLRLIPPCILLLLLSSLDRVNISFAALRMNADLGFSPEQYGLGAGIFFLGYLAAQFPSVLLQKRIGMRLWVGICALTWGAAATGMAFIDSLFAFCTLRVILGIAEAGLAAGLVLYLCQWTTPADRARTFALPMLAIPIGTIFGAPLSGWLLTMDAPFGLTSWRWMFLAEGVPTLLAGVFAYFYFPNHPREASWLAPEERTWLATNSIAAATPAHTAGDSPAVALRNPLIWMTAGVWFLLLAGSYGILFWLPQVIEHSTGLGPLAVSIVSAVPWVGAAIGMMGNSWHSDRSGERFWHIAVPSLIAALCIATPVVFASNDVAVLALFIGGIGLGAAQGAFWAMPTGYLDARTLTVGVTTINIAGSSAGLVIPHLIGWVRETTGSFEVPIYLVASMLLAAAGLVAIIRAASQRWQTFSRSPALHPGS